MGFEPNPAFQERVRFLLQKNREQGLCEEEEQEWEHYEYLEHLMRMAKARAHKKIAKAS